MNLQKKNEEMMNGTIEFVLSIWYEIAQNQDKWRDIREA